MKLHWKKSLLVIQKILRLFLHTLTVDDKDYLLNRDNLTQPIQMESSEKQKKIKSTLNFKHLPKK